MIYRIIDSMYIRARSWAFFRCNLINYVSQRSNFPLECLTNQNLADKIHNLCYSGYSRRRHWKLLSESHTLPRIKAELLLRLLGVEKNFSAKPKYRSIALPKKKTCLSRSQLYFKTRRRPSGLSRLSNSIRKKLLAPLYWPVSLAYGNAITNPLAD